MEIWHIWLILAAIAIISEMFHQGFVLICFGVGFFLGMVASLLNWGTAWQVAFFAIGTFIALIGIRPFIVNFMEKRNPEVKTNTDALVGKSGIVIEAIEPESSDGRIKVGGEDWWAVSNSGVRIEKDEQVTIVRIEGVKVYVTKKA
ncbi:MAG TPA: NfeD family protein [Rectinemataceae bacterium]|nr:NfeD family protein [Rectinemataceae bacterium]